MKYATAVQRTGDKIFTCSPAHLISSKAICFSRIKHYVLLVNRYARPKLGTNIAAKEGKKDESEIHAHPPGLSEPENWNI